ncbi:unnamed protein product [Peronospora belbahrii]|uniref:SET domain-containing protein n=1 Tax=Peronospora belbahrii TaxID=622444 RepID=A0AAU9KSJ7_9STRA|nr:unnamed protein product [Peronospora belbahrii]
MKLVHESYSMDQMLPAMINHSCDPNCAITFVSKTLDMEIRAMKPIKSGEEITQTYVDIALPRRAMDAGTPG